MVFGGWNGNCRDRRGLVRGWAGGGLGAGVEGEGKEDRRKNNACGRQWERWGIFRMGLGHKVMVPWLKIEAARRGCTLPQEATLAGR